MATKILVVDDDPNICDLLRLYFENEGYEVKTAGDGAEGVSFFISSLQTSTAYSREISFLIRYGALTISETHVRLTFISSVSARSLRVCPTNGLLRLYGVLDINLNTFSNSHKSTVAGFRNGICAFPPYQF